MSGSELYLSITPLKLSEIPSEDAIITAGREVLDEAESWKQGKSYHHHTVKTFHRKKGPKDGAAWYARVSEHDKEDATFEEFWSKLGENKAENEMQYVPEIDKVQLIKQISPNQSVWTLFYRFPPPVSPRVFTVVQTTWLSETSPRTGIIVSTPVDVSDDADAEKLEEKGVKGRYSSVERIQELDNGKVEWRMATSSTPGGSIPQFVADSSMASTISNDVKHFIAWLKGVRDSKETAVPASATGDGIPPSAAETEEAGSEAASGAA
ncbi:hypothetical protein LXA43DRAFT_114317 [Ganoderma leucocontextum]|nr:hypothetical protein LXA43DRAFT_114317 [Ganoderma leucocontextum]